MSNSYPDIEIYVKRPALADIREWLNERIGIERESVRGKAAVFTLRDVAGSESAIETGVEAAPEPTECVVVENAVKGGYASIWFRPNRTPWQTDQECAREAFDRFGLEVRCSAAPWEGQDFDEDAGGWIRLTEKGESRVNWHT